jgi:hypothetical protein
MTYRFSETHRNTDATTNQVFPKISEVFFMDYKTAPDPTVERSSDIHVEKTDMVFEYTEPGDAETSFLGRGGFSTYFNSGEYDKAKEILS